MSYLIKFNKGGECHLMNSGLPDEMVMVQRGPRSADYRIQMGRSSALISI